MQTLSLQQLKAATLAGGVTDISLRGDGAAFVINVQTQRGQAVMVTTRKQPRRFTDPRKALQVLRSINWHQCHIDTTDWQPDAPAPKKVTRPDRRAALKLAHEAALADTDYDRWFHARVQASLDGIESGSNRLLKQEEVAARRASLRERLESMRPSTLS